MGGPLPCEAVIVAQSAGGRHACRCPGHCYNAARGWASVPANPKAAGGVRAGAVDEVLRTTHGIRQGRHPATHSAVSGSAQPEDSREVGTSGDSGQARAARRRRGGCGCWLTGLFTLFLILVLVAVGLFLPPVQLIERLTGPQFFPINADAYAVQLEGLTLQVDPAAPGEGFSVAIDSLAANDFLAGAAGPEWLAATRSALPAQLALQSPVYSLYSEGMAPETLTLDLALPAAIGNAQLFSLYGWDGMSWDFLPSTQLGTGALRTTVERLPQQLAVFQVSPPAQPTVLVTVEVQHTLNPEVAQVANIVAPAGIQPTLTGGLTGSLAAGFDFNSGYLVMPVVRNFTDERALDSLTVSSILANRELRQAHVAQLTAFANSGFGGLLIDWRGLEPDQRRLFSEFIRELAGGFAAMGLKLGVVVPPAAVVDGTLDTGAYDWRALGRHADYLQVRLPLQPRDYGTGAGQPVELMLRHAVGEVERGRLLAGFSASTLRESEGSLTSAGYARRTPGWATSSSKSRPRVTAPCCRAQRLTRIWMASAPTPVSTPMPWRPGSNTAPWAMHPLPATG